MNDVRASENTAITVALKLSVTGPVGHGLLDHLGQAMENSFHTLKAEGQCTPFSDEDTDPYEDTEMELSEVTSVLDREPAKTPEDWFAAVQGSRAFVVNGQVCGDFSYPSSDDPDDDAYAFYMYGPKGVSKEVFFSCGDVVGFKSTSASEAVFELKDGAVHEIRALS